MKNLRMLFLLLVGFAGVARADLNEDLMCAVESGNLEEVQALLEYGADIDVQDYTGGTALMNAVYKGDIDIVRLLVGKDCDLDVRDDHNRTALMYAVFQRYAEIVSILLENGADVKIQNNENCTALMLAAGNGYSEILKLFLEKDSNLDVQDSDGFTPLMRASCAVAVLILIEKGRYIGMQDESSEIDLDALTQSDLINIFYEEYVEIIRLLLENGANVDIENHEGETALTLAVRYKHTRIAELLNVAGTTE